MHRLRIAALTALVLGATLPLDLEREARAQPFSDGHAAGGAVRGTVRVLRSLPLLGLRESDDRSGAVVYLTGFVDRSGAQVAYLNQHDERFDPRILPVVAGQTVTFPNRDPIYHNVFSVSANQPFDLGQYKSSDPPRSVVFERAGLVTVYCNIHPQMISYVVVLENGAFAVTDRAGAFAIEAVPPGDYTANAWIPGAQRVSQPVHVEAGGSAAIEFELRQTERIGPHKRKDGSDYPKPRYGDE